MQEREIKVHVTDVDAVRRRIAATSLRPAGTERQEDTYFQHPCRDLAASDEALRLRSAGDTMELTYKGPREGGAGDAKVRQERTVAVAQDPTPLLRGIGFQRAATLVKERQTWDGDDVEVALDHLQGLGWFLEVEAKREGADLHAVLASLHLQGAPVVAASYLELALASGAAAASTL